jgi:uncharacterized protein with HEPN domain
MRDSFERLQDIQEAIARIVKYTGQGRETFDQSEPVQSLVILHLINIGEAVRSIPPDFKDQHPEIPWAQINRMRNILVHIYFGIDLDIVWSVVENDLPILKSSIDAILNTESNGQ